jgi:hypothetical protein
MTIDPLTAWHSSAVNLHDSLLSARMTPEHSTGDLAPFVVEAVAARRRAGRVFGWLTARARPIAATRPLSRWTAGRIAEASR